MSGFVNIGFGNLINTAKLVAVVDPDAAPIRRLIQHAKEEQRCVDATQGRKTKSVLIMDGDVVVLSALVPETIARRFAPAGQEAQEQRNFSEY